MTVPASPRPPWSWSVVPVHELTDRVRRAVGTARPAVVAVDGHSSSGKSSLAPRLGAALPRAAVLHTDDLAWHHGVLSWDTLLLEHVLPDVRAGRPVRYRPPGWVARGREGAVELPGDLQLLLVEGVGASQPSLAGVLDLVLWVETDEPTRLARDQERVVGAGEMSLDDYASWMAEENAYVTASRPWEHATFLLNGSGLPPHDRGTEVVVASATL